MSHEYVVHLLHGGNYVGEKLFVTEHWVILHTKDNQIMRFPVSAVMKTLEPKVPASI